MKTSVLLLSQCNQKYKMLLVMFFIIFSGFVHNVQSQSVVYIDPTYTGGQNDGSLQHPFKSWSNISNFRDNTLYVQRRGTYDTINSSIQFNHKIGIKLGVYGYGNDYAHIHNNVIGGNVPTIDISTSRNCQVDSLYLTGNFNKSSKSYNVYCGILFSSGTVVDTFIGNNFKISNCVVERARWGIRSYKRGGNPYDTLIIENVKIRNIFADGIFIQGSSPEPLHGLDINHCYIDSVNMAQPLGLTNEGDGIQLSEKIDGWIIRNSTIDRRSSSNKFCIIHNDASKSNLYSGVVENCTLLGGVNTALYLEGLDTVIVRNNRILYDNGVVGVQTRFGTRLLCSYNVFSIMSTGKALRVFDLGSGPNIFHNNTFYGATTVFFSTGYTSDVYNNIFYNAGNVYDGNVLTSPDYNLYYNSTVNTKERNSIYNLDPLFVNASGGDFRLSSGSPAIDKGTNLGYTSDIVGTSLPQGFGYEMGAYEYIRTDLIPPTRPTHLKASEITYTGFKLTWNPSIDATGVTGYDVYINGAFLTNVSENTAVVGNLTQGRPYFIMVKARDGDGNLSKPAILMVMTLRSSDRVPPSEPSGLNAINIGQTRFTLTWEASTDNVGVKQYDVFKDGILLTSVTSTSAIVTGSAGTRYAMQVRAKDSVGNASVSDTFYVNTLPICTGFDPWTNTPIDTQTGTFIAEYDVVPGGDGLDGVTGLSGVPAAGYGDMAVIVRFSTSGVIDARMGVSGYGAVNNFPYTAGTAYHVKIVGNVAKKLYDAYVKEVGATEETIIASQYAFRAVPNQINNFAKLAASCHLVTSNISILGTLDTIAPTPCTELTATDIRSTRLTLKWSGATDNVGVTGYDIFQNGALKTSVVGTSVVITGLSPITTYNYMVKAKDGAANISAASMTISVTTQSDNEAPTTPTGLRSGAITQTSFRLFWVQSSDNIGVTGYDVYKDGVLYTTVPVTSAEITGLSASATYTMTVRAKDAAGNISGASSALLVTTSDTDAPTAPTGLRVCDITASGVTLNWEASTDNVGVTGYDVYVNNSFNKFVTTTSTKIYGLHSNTSYNVYVKARDAVDNVSESSNIVNFNTLSICSGGPMPFTNTSFDKQAGLFTVEYDVIPGGNFMEGFIGLSDKPAHQYNSLSCIVRFNWLGLVDVLNGQFYMANQWFHYKGDVAYHVRMVVNANTHRYDVYIKEIGETEVAIASHYLFRKPGNLSNWCVQTNLHCLAVSNFSLSTLKSGNIAEESEDTNSILIYPNPTDNNINVQLSERSVVKICDMQGRLLIEKVLNPGQNLIRFNLEAGAYLVRVVGESGHEYSSELIVK